MKRFESGWPASFHAPIQKRVQTMARVDKHQKVEDKVADTETLYARAMVLCLLKKWCHLHRVMGLRRSLDLHKFLIH